MNVNQRKVGVILSYVSLILYALVGFFYVPLLLKYLGKNEYGLFQLMGSLVAYFAVMDFGLSSTVVKYYSEFDAKGDHEGLENTLGLAKRIYYILTLIVLVMGVVVYFNIESIFQSSLSVYEIDESKKIFVLLIVNFVITLLTNIYTSIIMANEKFIFIRVLAIFQTMLQPFVIVALIMMYPKALTVVLIQTVFNLIVGIIKYFYSEYMLKQKMAVHYVDKKILKSMLTFASSVFLVSIVDQVFWKSNQIILGIISGTSVVAVYSVAAQIYMNYTPLSTVIQGVFLPRITKLVAGRVDKKELSDYFIRIGRIQYVILLCVLLGFFIFGKEFIAIWVGKDYMSAYWIALIIMVPFTIDLIQNLGLTILQAKNLYGFRAKVYLLSAIGSIILAVILSKKYGAEGAAFATGLMMLIANGLVMNIFYYKIVGINIPEFWLQIFKITLPGCIPIPLSFMLKRLYPINNFSGLLIEGLIYVFVYLGSIWVLGLNDYEKNLLIKPLKKIINK